MSLIHLEGKPSLAAPRSGAGELSSAVGKTEASSQTLSIVVTFFNEAGNVRFVLEELHAVLPEAEIIAVDDGSTDATWQELLQVSGICRIRFERNLGQSAAIYYGLRTCTGDICGLMDGDGQNDPFNFRRLLSVLNQGNTDVVCGYRANRHDAWNRKAASYVANTIRRCFLDDGVRDTGCTQKIFRREAIDLLVPFRGMHRYIPAFFKRAGLRIVEFPVHHRTRRTGQSKYDNWTRATAGIYDLFGVAWLLKRRFPLARMEKQGGSES